VNDPQYHERVQDARLTAAATAALDEAIDRMGADVCIWSVDLLIDEIAADVGTDPAEEEHLRAILRTRVGLA
jgi:hypothetical protein